jgi:deazaflavin-dependent oxidoreductase (nitroreductase family)
MTLTASAGARPGGVHTLTPGCKLAYAGYVDRLPAVEPSAPSSAIKRLMVGVALSPPGTWFYMNVASRIDPGLIRLSRGRIDSSFGMVPLLLLTTRGARSGLERTVPLLYFTQGDDVVLMASSFGRPRYPAWYHNLRANPEAGLYRRGIRGRYRAQEVEGAERDRLYALATGMYRGYGLYEQRVQGHRHVPVLRLSPVSPPAPAGW